VIDMAIVGLPLPIQLINGNVADGGQVMTDLNAIASNVNANAAKNGVNSDITALLALTTIATGVTITNASLLNPTVSGGTFTGISIVGSTIDATTTGVTLPVGTNTNQLATMAALLQAAFQATLPGQPGGLFAYYLQSKANVISWQLFTQPVGSINYLYLTAGGL
jgi:hypothetical protein